MKLPIYELAKDGSGNANVEGPDLTVVGPGSAQPYRPDLLTPYSTFILEGAVGYQTTVESTQDWTLEVVPRNGGVINGTVISSSGIRSREDGWSVRVQSNAMYIHYSSTDNSYYEGRFLYLPKLMQGESRPWRIVKYRGILTFYFGDDLVWEVALLPTKLVGTINLMANITNGSASNSPTAPIERVRFNPDHTLEPSLFYRPKDKRDKAYDNSKFVDEDYLISDTDLYAVESFSSYLDRVIVKYSDGELESFHRPQGTDTGNYISDIALADGEYTVTLNDGTEFAAGTAPETKIEIASDIPTGSGYKVDNQLLPFATMGNLYYLEDGQLKANLFTRNSLDYAARIRLTAGYSAAEATANAAERDVNGWSEIDVTYTLGKTPITEIRDGVVHLLPGRYYVDGRLVQHGADGWLGTLTDADNNILVSTALKVASRSVYGELNYAVLQGTFLVSKPTALKVRWKSAMSIAFTFTDSINLVNLEIFKVG